MNKKILLKILLPISVVGLIGGGIASSLVACSNKKDYIVLNTKEGVMEYLDKNIQHCEEKEFKYTTGGFGTESITDLTNYWNFIKEVYNKQAFINTLLFYEAIFYDNIWYGTKPEIVIGKNLLIVSYYIEDEYCKDEWQIKKWNSIDDSSFSLISEPGAYRPNYDFNSDLTISEANRWKFPETSDAYLVNINLDYEEETSWFCIWSDYPEITYLPVS